MALAGCAIPEEVRPKMQPGRLRSIFIIYYCWPLSIQSHCLSCVVGQENNEHQQQGDVVEFAA
jgi:hypothetical protein